MPLDGSQNYYYPPGTPGVPNQTIESEAYNTFLDDLVMNDLNIPRPISRGGTGGSTAAEGLTNLGGFPSAGGTVTGSITMTTPVGVSAAFALNKPSTGLTNVIYGLTNSAQRWQLHLGDTTAETGGGSSSGSDFSINRVLDSGDAYQNVKLDRVAGRMTLNGQLTINHVSAEIVLSTTGTSADIYGKKAGLLRWQIQVPNATSEIGLNSGSDFQLRRYADNGTTELGAVLTIYRDSGLFEVNGLVRTNVGRFVSQEPTCASFGLVVPGSIAAGMYGTPGANIIRWGAMDALGQPTLEWATLSPTTFSVGNVSATTATVSGAVSAGSLSVSGNATVGVNLTAVGSLTAQNTVYSTGGKIISQHSTVGAHPSVTVYNSGQGTAFGMYLHTDNTLSWGTTNALGVPSSQLMTLDNLGRLKVDDTVFAMTAGADQNNYMGGNGTANRLFSFTSGYFWQWDASSGNTTLTVNSTMVCGVLPSTYGFYAFVNGYKPGGGSWADSSDLRIKNVIGEYNRGLGDINKLRPVLYTFKGNDTSSAPAFNPKQPPEQESRDAKEVAVPYENSPHYLAATDQRKFAGLIAQEVEAVMPEMVTQRGGYIDGAAVTDLRDLDTTPLIFALINSIKELTARVEQLEAAG